ncbi:EAL domain-containing protein [Ferrimonas lipolytica]|uniref:EAL domain-containing protein n=1 Tax=Ferrimonas lipolytica TaxID=2724191 RepID=A0A6H1UIV4_9GAMM|nr:EAL domain-containing protein [Ferrimonas lipolytica]QIZ78559.1 EAL domain-containing protein [Ferrimonas lipolytica]
MWLRLWCFALLLWTNSSVAEAVRVVGFEQGLQSQIVLSTLEDQEGLLWIGTEDGLYRMSDRVVRRVDDLNVAGQLSNSVFRALQRLPDQQLLLSTAGQIALFDIANNQFLPLSERFPNLDANSSTGFFYQDHQRDIWFITNNGHIYKLRSDLNALTLVGKLPAGQRYRQIYHHADGGIWVMAPHQLWHLNEQGVVLDSEVWDDAGGELTTLLDVDRDTLWIASTQGLVSMDVHVGKDSFKTLLTASIRDLEMDPRGNVWLLGRGKLWLWSIGAVAPTEVPMPTVENFDPVLVLKLMLDSNQRLWFMSGYHGLVGMRPPMNFVAESYTPKHYPQMPAGAVWHIWADDEQRLLATDGGLQWFDVATNSYRHIELPGLDDSGAAWAIWPLDPQRWLIGSSNGLYEVDRTTLQAKPLIPVGAPELAKRSIYVIVPSGDALLLITDLQTFRWKPGRDIEHLLIDGEAVIGVRNAHEDEQQRLWLAGEGVLGYLDHSDQYHSLLPLLPQQYRLNSFSMLLPISEQRLWFGNYGHGLWQYDSRWNEVVSISEHLGLNCDNPNFATTHNQSILLGCDRSLYRIDPAVDEVIGIDRYDGLPIANFNEGAMFYDESLGFMVGSSNGMAVLQPDQMFVVERRQRALFESLELQLNDGTSQVWLRPELSKIELDASAQLVTFQFASNRLLDPNPKRYRYKLNYNGNEGELITINASDRLTFSHLKAGDYELLLFGSSNASWQSIPSRVRFTVNQAWWQYSAAQFATLTLAVILLVLLILLLRSKLRRGNKALKQLSSSQQRLHIALDASDSDSWEWHREDNLIRISDRKKIFSASGDVLIAEPDTNSIHPDDRLRVKTAWQNHISNTNDRYDVIYRQTDYSGQWRWIHTMGKVVTREPNTNKPISIAGIYTDITENRRLEQEHTLYALAFEHAAEGVFILDRDLQIVGANPAAASILGCSPTDLHNGELMHFWLHEQSMSVNELLQQPTPWQGEVFLFNRQGNALPMQVSLSTMHSGSEQRWIFLFSDISIRKQTEAELQRLANFDPLTGLLNRSNFNKQVAQLLEKNALLSQPSALLFLDLDRFKNINDSFGHSSGDELLVEAARRLQQYIGPADMLCRFGGDEFVVFVPDALSTKKLEQLADRLLHAFSQPFEVGSQVFYISTSIGISRCPEDGEQLEFLVKNADLAMYQAKEEGRGRFCFYTKQRNDQMHHQLALDSALREALLNERLQLYYQPQIDLDSGRILGIEALLRWFDVAGGAIHPEEFIAIAESNGFIIQLDRWALKQACREFVRWDGVDANLVLSVNVSATNFRQAEFVDYVEQVLQQTQMKPQSLCIEITEGVLMHEVKLVQHHLHALQQLGVRVAIDDFGTGYSSLAYLSQFAVDQVKIDRSFVLSLPQSEVNAAIIRTIIDLGRNLNLEVLAEGVETATQQQFLQEQGCSLVQGFRYARPMSAPLCLSFIQQWQGVPAEDY